MIIDFKKLEDVQTKYSSELSTDTLAVLLGIVLDPDNQPNVSPSASYITAVETLSNLGIIKKSPDKKEVQQLNS